MPTSADVLSMIGEAARTIDGLERRNENLEGQVRVVRVFEMALQAGRGEGMVGGQWGMAERLRILAKEIEREEKLKGATASQPDTQSPVA